MIVQEYLSDKLVRHYSDAGLYIRQVETGAEYSEAVDVVPCQYTYEETDKPIEVEPVDELEDARHAVDLAISGGVV